MFINIIKSYRTVVAVCDKELLGKIFEQDFENVTRQLDVKENFYKGKEVDEKSAIEEMQKYSYEDATFNIVGPRAVKAAIEAGIITPDGVGEVAGIPFALVLA